MAVPLSNHDPVLAELVGRIVRVADPDLVILFGSRAPLGVAPAGLRNHG